MARREPLDARARAVLDGRHPLDGPRLQLWAMGEVLGVSGSRVQQIEQDALIRLAHWRYRAAHDPAWEASPQTFVDLVRFHGAVVRHWSARPPFSVV